MANKSLIIVVGRWWAQLDLELDHFVAPPVENHDHIVTLVRLVCLQIPESRLDLQELLETPLLLQVIYGFDNFLLVMGHLRHSNQVGDIFPGLILCDFITRHFL